MRTKHPPIPLFELFTIPELVQYTSYKKPNYLNQIKTHSAPANDQFQRNMVEMLRKPNGDRFTRAELFGEES